MKTDAEVEALSDDDRLLLKLEGEWSRQWGVWPDVDAMDEAARLIREQRAEIARLNGTSQVQQNFFNAAMDRANAAEQRIAELEGILRAMVLIFDGRIMQHEQSGIVDSARAALTPRKAET